jgi:preprotein translocase subunit SecA
VLGSERHESRRIDNQLRGRSGRQGDPGESRFYLSLEDELMRLFATGAMNFVMGRALPEDVPIEARMVTRAIERAQHTVEARNAETRKDVFKYDDVMNEQRKVIYERRLQIIDGEDLRIRTEELLVGTIARVVQDVLPNDYTEEWDLERLVTEIQQYYPTQFTPEDLAQGTTAGQVAESFVAEALEYYDRRERELPGGTEMARELERQVMLQIIDQRWRDHLAEMDYLREGIHLRGIAQTDPLVAWQREGYAMFGQLMDSIDDDYLRYVMHVEVLVQEPTEPDFSEAQYEAAEDPVQDTTAALAGGPIDAAAAASGNGAGFAQPAAPAHAAASGRAQPPAAPDEETLVPTVLSPREKMGRNEPCWCGSGKKFKLCHGAN